MQEMPPEDMTNHNLDMLMGAIDTFLATHCHSTSIEKARAYRKRLADELYGRLSIEQANLEDDWNQRSPYVGNWSLRHGS
jgi:hypothetical protein